jgi:hypothetical protein
MKKPANLLFLPLSLVLLSLACDWLLAPRATESPAGLYTQAAVTLRAQLTNAVNIYTFATMTALAQPANATPTTWIYPTSSPASATSIIPSVTPIPTVTPQPTQETTPCNQATFIKDVTVGDSTVFTPGMEFTKIWRLKNTGTCSWDNSYALLYIGGDYMGSPKTYPIHSIVSPGELVDIAVDLIAPSTSGKYTSYWMLMDASSQLFGVGDNGEDSFWVRIKVAKPNNNFAYDFATNMCVAVWRSSAGDLPCPGDTSSSRGSVTYLGKPYLEDGRHENEPTLWTRPETVKGGWIKGVYPSYKVKDNDHFLAEIGCLEGFPDCKVTFALDYQISGKPVKHLGEWYEVYDDNVTLVDIDLSGLAGKSVHFILKVTNNGKPAQGNAFWFVPSIRKVTAPSPTRTPTPTRTLTPTPTITGTPPDTATPTVTPTSTATATVTLTPQSPPVETVTETPTPTSTTPP